jgi:hypothetical protein
MFLENFFFGKQSLENKEKGFYGVPEPSAIGRGAKGL